MILDEFKLQGKVAIVTGGTSGIGLAVALGLAEAGAILVPASRSREKVQEAVSKIRKIGGEAMELTVDVLKPEEISSFTDKVMDRYGKIDILVNNAGTTIKKPFLEQTWEDWTRVMDLNLNSVFSCCKIIGKSMVDCRQGSIINMASVGSESAITGSLPYCVSKGGLLQLTRTLSAEWASFNVRVNAIAPAYFITPMTRGILEDKKRLEAIVRRIPMGRLGETEELKGAAVYLASKASAYVTGTIIYVDGGFSCNSI